MNICPKCRAFYDDELLRFCLADGSPLVAVGGNDANWEVGESALRVVKQAVRRETVIQWIKQIVWTLITTIIVVSVIYVVVMNTWIYLGGPEKYFPKTVEQSTPTPTPTPTPVIEVESPTPTPTLTPIPERTASPTPTATPTPILARCDQALEQQRLGVKIDALRAEIRKDEARIQEKWSRELGDVPPQIVATPEFGSPIVNIGEDCRSAKISLSYTWSIRSKVTGRRTFERDTRTLSCRNDKGWSCK